MIRRLDFAANEWDFVSARAPLWSEEEIVIILYFLSRQIRPRTLRFLLLCPYDRTTRAIERKIFSIIQRYPHLKPSKDYWNLDAVDNWIDGLLGSRESVNTLIRFSPADAEDVVHVSCFFGITFSSCLLSPAPNSTKKLKSLWSFSIL